MSFPEEEKFEGIAFKKNFSFIHDENPMEPMELFWDHLTIKAIKKPSNSFFNKKRKTEEKKAMNNDNKDKSGIPIDLSNDNLAKSNEESYLKKDNFTPNFETEENNNTFPLEKTENDAFHRLNQNKIQKAKTNSDENIILNSIKGVISPSSFTAILGPSGSGKTTLLNFLSGRIKDRNLEINGTLQLNKVDIPNIEDYSNKIAYVQQNDILLAVFTPEEAFTFSANIRLRISKEERREKVRKLIRDLGLLSCSRTKIGSELIRGISGGERKRTSIGVELLTNPSMIFLDEPTTGLDSNTAVTIMFLLRDLANNGRTVVSVIHQPSTEIFNKFDRLILLCKGNIIYQGDSQTAVDYFSKIGYPCPAFTNPSDFFMKIMNPQGLLIEYMEKGEVLSSEKNLKLMQEFNNRLLFFVNSYRNTDFFKNFEPQALPPIKIEKEVNSVPWINQFGLIMKRELTTIWRNPFDLRVKVMQFVVFALICAAVYHDLGEGDKKVQNTNGLMFFLANIIGMSSISSSSLTFSMDRPLFLRESSNKSYCLSAFYVAKIISEQIYYTIYPFLVLLIVYFLVDLNKTNDYNFWIFLLTMEIGYLTGTAYGSLISVFVPKFEMAVAMTPVLIVPFMIFSGFLVNQANIPYFFYEIEYISPFRYMFVSFIYNQYDENKPNCGEINCDPIKDLGFDTTKWDSIIILACLGIGLRICGLFGLIYISRPPKTGIKK